MTIKKIERYLILFIMFFSLANISHASFEITEIMYDQEGTDTNREWIEVKNVGSTPSDLSKWFLFSDNTKHTLVPQGDSVVPVGGYAVIVQNVPQFMVDESSFQGIIFDSSWTGFNNTTETISLKDSSLNIVSPVTYTSGMGGNGNGNSLSRINDIWQNGTPTPGKDNQKAIIIPPAPVKKPIQKTPSVTDSVDKIFSSSDNLGSDSQPESKEVINLNNLSVLDGQNDLKTNTSVKNNDNKNLFYSLMGLFIIIGLGIVSYLAIKKKHRKSEKISAEDMTIVD